MVVFEHSVGTAVNSWTQQEADLSAIEHRRLDVCVEVRAAESILDNTESWAFWGSPFVVAAEQAVEPEDSADELELTDEELEVRRRLLETHGYVN